MISRARAGFAGLGVSFMTLAACTPTINVKVEPISIYAKLDANIRVKLDKEVQSAIQQNPNLFN